MKDNREKDPERFGVVSRRALGARSRSARGPVRRSAREPRVVKESGASIQEPGGRIKEYVV
ncbi:hypothetical protein V0288_05125 [Pannus brasiliensis CCIBt3594]|uniref:Uncharacterized protein n=1 Tax=Pannus brasiliensis CCIBt3594 TaxID=1427578 RepID=A0AAW9QT46_9CHRO